MYLKGTTALHRDAYTDSRNEYMFDKKATSYIVDINLLTILPFFIKERLNLQAKDESQYKYKHVLWAYICGHCRGIYVFNVLLFFQKFLQYKYKY